MKRVAAFLIDHMILAYIFVIAGFFLLDSSGGFVEDEMVWIYLIAGLLCYLGYFFVWDYFFQGMTPGKKIIGVRLQWYQGEGFAKVRDVVQHIVLRTGILLVWPIALICYLSSNGKMPYDQRLGILYLADESGKQPGWKVAVKAGAVIVALYLVFLSGLFLVMQKMSGNAYYSFENEKIASLSAVLGKQKMVGYSSSGHSSSMKVTYQYKVEDGEESASRYAEYLVQQEGFAYVDGDSMVLNRVGSGDVCDVTVELVENGKYLQVTLQYDR